MALNWTNKTDGVDDVRAEDFNNAFESINEALSGKVDVDGSKVLSDENFTTEEKDKLAGLENYDDTELKKLIENLPAVSGSITEIDYKDIDTLTTSGIYKLVNIPSGEVFDKISDDEYSIYTSGEELLFVYSYDYYSDGVINESAVIQVRHRRTNDIVFRGMYNGNEWDPDWIKADYVSIVNNLESTSATSALSANMGRSLSLKIGAIEDVLDAIIALQESYIGGEGV